MAEDDKEKKATEKAAEPAKAEKPEADEAQDKVEVEAKPDETEKADAAEQADDTEAEKAKDEEDGDAAFRPEEIAKRIDTVGEESELERVAREEERKLAERRKQQRKAGGKKKGLETAASKRLSKIGEKTVNDSFSIALRAELAGTGVSVTCLMPGATETEFFERAGMLDTKVGSGKKQPASEVAKIGFDAMMRGTGNVVSGWQNKLQAAIAHVLPAGVLAEIHRKKAAPGTAVKG